MSQDQKISIRKFELELNPHEIIKDLTDDKKKEQCWIKEKNRQVDGFIMGACRAIYFGLNRKKMDSNEKRRIGVMFIDQLKDRDRLFFILSILGYYDRLLRASTTEDHNKTHEILFNLNECLRITEEYFKAGWIESNDNHNFKILLEEEYPNPVIIKDLNLEVEDIDEGN